VPPGRYRRGSVSHSWSETVVAENSTMATAGTSPERLYTPVDELLAAAQQQVRAAAEAGTPASSTEAAAMTDDGSYSSSTTRLFTADFTDTRQSTLFCRSNERSAISVSSVCLCVSVCSRISKTAI